jgi:hypothetical protein
MAAGIWLAVYLALVATGQRFSTAYLDFAWQLVPTEILRDDPIGSTWYLHIQPPLWNLTIGSVLAWSPFPDAISLQLLQLALGLVLVALLASTLDRLGASRKLATLFAVIATVHPDVIGNAFTPTYELVTATLLVGLVWLIASSRRSHSWLVAIAAVASTITLTRSLYHPLWIALIIVVVIVGTRRLGHAVAWRSIATVCVVPLLSVGGWMAKNEVVFGRATLSSWFGMNLQRAVIPVLPADELAALRADGKVSEIAMVGPFGNYDLYKPFVEPCLPEHGAAATSVALRPTEVIVPNFNYECFLPIYDQAGRDAWAVIKASPGTFIEGRLWSARTWFAINGGSAGSPSIVMRSLDRVGKVAGLAVPGVVSTRGWGTPIYGTLEADADFPLVFVVLTLVVVAAAVRSGWRLVRRTGATGVDLVYMAVGLTVAWTFASGIMFELGEQARFRTMVDPLVTAIGLHVVVEFWRRRRTTTALAQG